MAEQNNYTFIASGAEPETPQQEAVLMGRPNPTQPSKPMGTAKTAMLVTLAVDSAKQIGNKVTSSIGKFTGNTILQQNIDFGKEVAGTLIAGAVNPLLLIPVAIDKSMGAVEYYWDLRQEQKTLDQQRARSGMAFMRNK